MGENHIMGTRIELSSLGLKSPHLGKVQYLINVSHFRDPLGNSFLTTTCADGRDKNVQTWIRSDLRFSAVMDTIRCLANDAKTINLSHISIGLADHHGKWTAPALTELAAKLVGQCEYPTKVIHYDLP
jgi:hypothetical protein